MILQTSEGAIEYGGLEQLASMARILSDEVDVPVVLHLDHGKSLEVAKQCIEAGYTSVMIDLSKKDLAENIRLTKEVVNYAHPRNVWVEAELGAILGTEGALELKGDKAPEDLMTKPEDVARFVEETGVDELAVSVGTIHGAFTGQEYIRFELIEQIAQAAPEFPLVLHGASGVAEEQLREAALTNVCKVNVDTEMRIVFEEAVKAYFGQAHEKIDPRKMIGPGREAVQQLVKDKIKIFGSNKQA